MPDSWPAWDADRGVAAIYQAHYRSLARIAALLLGGDAAVAEEVVQDAFVSVYRASPRLRDADEAVGYLRQAVVNMARVRSAVSSDPVGPPPGRTAAAHPAHDIAGSLLMAALRGLPARQREALVLKYYADWPDSQIAAAMGIRRRALCAYLQRGMSTLQAFAAPNRGRHP